MYVANFYRAFQSSRCIPSDLPLFRRNQTDLMKFICGQDVIYVGGGNTANRHATSANVRAEPLDDRFRRPLTPG
jgi:peptidase E